VRRVAEVYAPATRRLERRLRAGGDGFAFLFGDHGHNAYGHPSGARQVHGLELNPSVAKGEQESSIAGEAVKLGDDQRRAVKSAGSQGLSQFRPIVLLAALDLDVLRY
jgi:hypothetical protein